MWYRSQSKLRNGGSCSGVIIFSLLYPKCSWDHIWFFLIKYQKIGKKFINFVENIFISYKTHKCSFWLFHENVVLLINSFHNLAFTPIPFQQIYFTIFVLTLILWFFFTSSKTHNGLMILDLMSLTNLSIWKYRNMNEIPYFLYSLICGDLTC